MSHGGERDDENGRDAFSSLMCFCNEHEIIEALGVPERTHHKWPSLHTEQ